MARIDIANTLVGGFCLLLAGLGIVLPAFPEDTFDTFWLLVSIVAGFALLLMSAGPQPLRLRMLEWRTSRQGKAVEWGSGALLTLMFIWNFGGGIPTLLLAGVLAGYAIGGILFKGRYYERINNQKQQLRQDVND